MSEQPNPLQLDALREVANIGCGHAANALSRLVGGRRVDLELPRAAVLPVHDIPPLLGGSQTPVVAALFAMEGELTGHLLVVFPRTDARLLGAVLAGTPEQEELSLSQMSALQETANIVVSACLSAVGRLVRLTLLPSPPLLVEDHAGNIVAEAVGRTASSQGVVVVMEARFHTVDAPLVGAQLLVLPDAQSLKKLLEKLNV